MTSISMSAESRSSSSGWVGGGSAAGTPISFLCDSPVAECRASAVWPYTFTVPSVGRPINRISAQRNAYNAYRHRTKRIISGRGETEHLVSQFLKPVVISTLFMSQANIPMSPTLMISQDGTNISRFHIEHNDGPIISWCGDVPSVTCDFD